ncbi:MAG: 4'-phosphopantetheinyl transferase [Parasphingorhabdus sp.]
MANAGINYHHAIATLSVEPMPVAPSETRIQVYSVHLEQNVSILDNLHGLNQAESQRCKKFHRNEDQMRCAIAAILLRTLLARLFSIQPEEVQLTTAEFGKRILKNNPSDIHFNISHSGDWIALAFCRGREIGIDIEQTRSIKEIRQLMQHTFHSDEYAQIISQPASNLVKWFYTCWARKESLLKAMGTGLHIAPDRIVIDTDPATSRQFVPGNTMTIPDCGFSIEDLNCPDDYQAAIAVAGNSSWQIESVEIPKHGLQSFLVKE